MTIHNHLNHFSSHLISLVNGLIRVIVKEFMQATSLPTQETDMETSITKQFKYYCTISMILSFVFHKISFFIKLDVVKKSFYIVFFRHLHRWGWCRHIWAVWGEDCLWRGACCSHTALYSSRIPSCIGPENRSMENRVRKKMRFIHTVDTPTHMT